MPICWSIYFPGGIHGKESALNAKNTGSIPGSGRSPEEGNGNPLQYYCLENLMDGGAWIVYSLWGDKESDTTERLHFTKSLNLLFRTTIPRAFQMLSHPWKLILSA